MIAGKDAKTFGEAKNSWLTGTAAWTFLNVSQFILGVEPTLKGLSVNPCIPKNFGDFTITRTFRGVEYNIEVKNPDNIVNHTAGLFYSFSSTEHQTNSYKIHLQLTVLHDFPAPRFFHPASQESHLLPEWLTNDAPPKNSFYPASS